MNEATNNKLIIPQRREFEIGKRPGRQAAATEPGLLSLFIEPSQCQRWPQHIAICDKGKEGNLRAGFPQPVYPPPCCRRINNLTPRRQDAQKAAIHWEFGRSKHLKEIVLSFYFELVDALPFGEDLDPICIAPGEIHVRGLSPAISISNSNKK